MWGHITAKALPLPTTIFSSFSEKFASLVSLISSGSKEHKPAPHRIKRHIFIFRLTLVRIQAAPFESCPAKTERGKQTDRLTIVFFVERFLDISERARSLLQTQEKALIHSFSLGFLLNIAREHRDFGGGLANNLPQVPREMWDGEFPAGPACCEWQ